MEDITVLMRCAYSDCGKATKIILEAARTKGRNEQMIQLTRYCEHCNRPNIISIPESWDPHASRLVYGDDKWIVDYNNDIPVIQGEQP